MGQSSEKQYCFECRWGSIPKKTEFRRCDACYRKFKTRCSSNKRTCTSACSYRVYSRQRRVMKESRDQVLARRMEEHRLEWLAEMEKFKHREANRLLAYSKYRTVALHLMEIEANKQTAIPILKRYGMTYEELKRVCLISFPEA